MEISIKDLFRIVKRGFWIMIISAIIFAILAFGYSKLFIQKTYTTSVKLYVEVASLGNSSYNDLSSYNYAASLVNTYIEMLQTHNFFDKVAENLDNKYTAKEIDIMVDFANESETEVFVARISANSPKEAKLVADSVADVAPGVISTLNDNAKLKIVDYAVTPTSPSSPNVMRNSLLAATIGFALAFIYIFIRELLDVKFKYNSDMTSYNDIPILATIPSFDEKSFSAMEYFSREPQFVPKTKED